MDNNNNRKNSPGGGRNPKNRTNMLIFMILAVIVLSSMYFMRSIYSDATEQEVPYSEFVELVKDGKVDSVVMKSDRITFEMKEDADKKESSGLSGAQVTYYTGVFPDEDLKNMLAEYGVTTYSREVPDTTGAVLYSILSYLIPIVLMVGAYVFIMGRMSRGGGMMGVGKSKAKVYMQKETGVTFKDVAGQDEAKESLQEVVDFLHNPGKYTKIGAKLPKGALLVGPPGTGKTLLAKAVAGEANVPLAATNRPEVLDQALLRPGRFDRRVIVDKPDLKGRVNILKVHSKDVHLDETVDLEAIALATSGAVGSDLANMINEAAILAVKAGRNMVSQKDLFEAVEVVLVGKEKKDRILSKEERRIVSYHEVGHALVSALQKDSEPVQKITIVPRTMGALGYVMNVPEEEKYLNTEKEIRAMLVEFVAGRAAEEIVFDTVTTGAANDIEKATRIARAMVTQYGMSPKFGLIGLETVESQYLSGRTVLNCSDEMAAEVDREVMQILKDSYAEAKRLLTENREALDKIAAFLIEKETITGKEFMEIFHQVRGDQPESTEGEKSRISEKQIGLPEAAESVKTEEPAAAGEEKTAETDAARAEIAEGAEAEQPAAKAETEDVE